MSIVKKILKITQSDPLLLKSPLNQIFKPRSIIVNIQNFANYKIQLFQVSY
jgi:hypothetical protein